MTPASTDPAGLPESLRTTPPKCRECEAQADPDAWTAEERAENRRAAMDLAREAAMRGDPIAGAFFGFESLIRRDEYGRFLVEFGDYEDSDYDDIRPY